LGADLVLGFAGMGSMMMEMRWWNWDLIVLICELQRGEKMVMP
jgi:hypothetical protein